MGEISMIGLDIAKNVFQVHAIDAAGNVVLRRQLRRSQVEKFLAICRRRESGWKPAAAPITGDG